MWAEGRGREDLEALFRMFPDCDTDHIVARLNAVADQPDRLEKVGTELAEKKYPLLRTRIVADQVTFN